MQILSSDAEGILAKGCNVASSIVQSGNALLSVIGIVAVTSALGALWYKKHVDSRQHINLLTYPTNRKMLERQIATRVSCSTTSPTMTCTNGSNIAVKDRMGGILIPSGGKVFGNVNAKGVCQSNGVSVLMIRNHSSTSWNSPAAKVTDLTHICSANSPKSIYGGTYSVYTDGVCITPNIKSNLCSCPQGFTSQPIFHFAPECLSGFFPSRRGLNNHGDLVCGFRSNICLKRIGG